MCSGMIKAGASHDLREAGSIEGKRMMDLTQYYVNALGLVLATLPLFIGLCLLAVSHAELAMKVKRLETMMLDPTARP